jgi:hypothetical protein
MQIYKYIICLYNISNIQTFYTVGEGNIDCSGNWSNWSECRPNIDIITRTYTIINEHKNNGLVCPSKLLEFKKCENKNIFGNIINFFKIIFLFIFSLFKK